MPPLDPIGKLDKLEDDSLNCGITASRSFTAETIPPKAKYNGTLRDRIIQYVMDNPKSTKGDIFIHVSGSGTCGTIITGLMRAGILEEHFFECHNCKYFTVDMSKVYEA
jgi:hypothetical protein